MDIISDFLKKKTTNHSVLSIRIEGFKNPLKQVYFGKNSND